VRLLDLFCGAGGAAVGYHRAGFDEVVGVDIAAQPRYPFEFVRADALEFLQSQGREFDAVHASPPCQAYSRLKSIRRFATRRHPALVGPVLNALAVAGVPYVVENVPGAGLPTHVMLCGSMFDLGAWCGDSWHQLRRHREFACSWYFLLGPRCRHCGRPVGVYGNGGAHRRIKDEPGIKGFTGTAAERRSAMGIDWMSRYELSQAIPPAYTEYLGRQLLAHLRRHDLVAGRRAR
jgi:DNA (cytosine-5)-methyltransferase 1